MRLDDHPDGLAFHEIERRNGLRSDVRCDDDIAISGTQAHFDGDQLLAASEGGDVSGKDVTGRDAAWLLDGKEDVSSTDGDINFC